MKFPAVWFLLLALFALTAEAKKVKIGFLGKWALTGGSDFQQSKRAQGRGGKKGGDDDDTGDDDDASGDDDDRGDDDDDGSSGDDDDDRGDDDDDGSSGDDDDDRGDDDDDNDGSSGDDDDDDNSGGGDDDDDDSSSGDDDDDSSSGCGSVNPSFVQTDEFIRLSGINGVAFETLLQNSIAFDAIVPEASELFGDGDNGDAVYDMGIAIGVDFAARPFVPVDGPEDWPIVMCATYKSWLAGQSTTCEYEMDAELIEKIILEYIDGIIFGINSQLSTEDQIAVEVADFRALSDCSTFGMLGAAPPSTTPAPVGQGGFPPCSVCGDGLSITLPDIVVDLPNQGPTLCSLFELGGELGFIDPRLCEDMPPLAEPCACA